jgi:hypothetical protein
MPVINKPEPMNNTEVKTEQFLRDERMLYVLHQVGYRKGLPQMCNKYWMSLTFDYANGVTVDEANKMAGYIHEAVNNYSTLKESTLRLQKENEEKDKRIADLQKMVKEAEEIGGYKF